MCEEISYYMVSISKKQDESDQKYFKTKALFETVLDLLLEANNIRISYVDETHAVEFIMLKIVVYFTLIPS